MRRTLLLPILGLAVSPPLLALLAAAGTHSPAVAEMRPAPEPALVNTLDRLCQEKFQTVDYASFGISRIALPRPSHPGLRQFKPETEAEKALVVDAREAGWDVVLSVAGRRALRAAKALQAAAPVSRAHLARSRVLSEAAVLTGGNARAALPRPEELLPQAAVAFKALEKKASYEFRTGEWSVIARPVRAEKAECVTCHRGEVEGETLQVGDVLGVAFYAFSPAALSEQ